MALLPDIGRNGLVNSVRRLNGLNNPGYRAVDATADFIAGMVAILEADSDGNPVLKVADATDTALIGLFFCHKTTNFYRPIVDESKTYGTSPNTAWVIYLDHANLKSGSVKVTDSTGGTTYTLTTDYTVNNTNGVITRTSTGSIAADETVLVTYLYEDTTLTGLDQTLGSGLAATLEDPGEVATLVYDTSKAYTLMGSLYADANGYLTSTDGGGTVVGKVTKVPTAENPELHFKLSIP
jgi:hypothetical protein